MRILIDTSVILDIIQKREPFFADSYQALRKAIETDAECLISASAATDIFYMLRKAFQSAQKAKERIEQLSQIVTFADVQGVDIHTALMRSMPDFEDGVVDAVAERTRFPLSSYSRFPSSKILRIFSVSSSVAASRGWAQRGSISTPLKTIAFLIVGIN